MRYAAAFLLLIAGAADCARRTIPPAGPPAAAANAAPTPVVVGEGESIETAVRVPAQSEPEGVDRENDWIWRHYGRFRKKSIGLATLAGRRYDVVTVELSDHSERTIYFDITEFYGKK